MYVATTQIQMGGGRVIQPGEPVPDFESWTYAARKASLDWGRVKLAPVSEPADQTAPTALIVATDSATNLPEALAELNKPAKKPRKRRNRRS